MTGTLDAMTHVWDRNTAISYVAHGLQDNRKVGVVLSDVDFFINIDSKIGEKEGDKVLCRIADFLKKTQDAFIGRYGGDEFIIIFMDMDSEQMVGIVENIRKNFRKERFISSSSKYAKVPITASFGIAIVNNYSTDVKGILRSAEIALSMAKKRGRNQVVLSPEKEIFILKDSCADVSTLIGGEMRGYNSESVHISEARLLEPYGVDITPDGDILIVDRGNHCVRKINNENMIETIAGQGKYGYLGDNGDARLARFNKPSGVAVDSENQIYIADTGNHCIRKISADGIIHTIAGCGMDGYEGDGGKAVNAKLSRPGGVVVDGNRNVYTNDYGNNVIRKITPDGFIYTVAGSGEFGYKGDGGDAHEAAFDRPYGLAVTRDGSKLYIADYGNHRIHEVDLVSNIIRTCCGSGEAGYEGDGGDARKARLNGPFWVCMWHTDRLLIADGENNCIRICNLKTGIISTLVGNGDSGYVDGIKLDNDIRLSIPAGMAIDYANNALYIADYGNNAIRRITLSKYHMDGD